MLLTKERVNSTEKALVYIIDCTLATVEYMAGLKRRPKHEFERQISIAQTGIDWVQAFKIDTSGTRIEEVDGDVNKWANNWIEKYKHLRL